MHDDLFDAVRPELERHHGRYCANCDKPIFSGPETKVYCSRECKQRASNRRHDARQRAKAAARPVKKPSMKPRTTPASWRELSDSQLQDMLKHVSYGITCPHCLEYIALTVKPHITTNHKP